MCVAVVIWESDSPFRDDNDDENERSRRNKLLTCPEQVSDLSNQDSIYKGVRQSQTGEQRGWKYLATDYWLLYTVFSKE